MGAEALAREDILALKGYRAGAQIDGSIRLNANEAPDSAADGDSTPLNRYPEVRPVRLQARLAELFDVPAANLLVTRGSSDAIDVIVRAWCRAYRDSMLVTPPTFEMYRFYADVQGIDLVRVPLRARDDFRFDSARILDACSDSCRLVFVCSPNNPTGSVVAAEEVVELVEALRDRAIVVVDEAYVEFADVRSLAGTACTTPNLVVLRTLSKAHGLAGARCGVAIGSEAVVDVMCRVLPPYSFPTPVIDSVLGALTPGRRRHSAAIVAGIVAERRRLEVALAEMDVVDRVWPSQANFLLVRLREFERVRRVLAERHILVRDFSNEPELENCVRITIGAASENDALLEALRDPDAHR